MDCPQKFHLNKCNCNICRKSFNCVSLLNSHKLNSGHLLVGCQRETLCFQFVMFSFDLVALVLDLQATQTWLSSICSIVVLLVSIKCSLQGFVNLVPGLFFFCNEKMMLEKKCLFTKQLSVFQSEINFKREVMHISWKWSCTHGRKSCQ